jgi:hypothetical protein
MDVDAAHVELYARLPSIDCQRHCSSACGPIVATEVEWERMQSVTGGGAWGDDAVCPHLDRDARRCREHPLRPLICRLWGVVETMPCPWGCAPERWLTAEEADVLVAEAIALADDRLTSGWHGWRDLIEQAPDARDPVA